MLSRRVVALWPAVKGAILATAYLHLYVSVYLLWKHKCALRLAS
jgi:hypothetical protein